MFLLLGAGNSKQRKVQIDGVREFPIAPISMDIDKRCNPDVLHDLNNLPYPFKDNMFDEVHAYEVLEHCGTQGDWRFFFSQFGEIHRILKAGGTVHFTVPSVSSPWAWGDPGHTRVIPIDSLIFLNQASYGQVGRTAMTDYRDFYKVNFDPIVTYEADGTLYVIMKATL